MHPPAITLPLPASASVSPLTWTPAQSDRVLLLALATTFVTSGHVAERFVYIELRNQNGLAYFRSGVPLAQAASLTERYCWARGAGDISPSAANVNVRQSNSLPWVWLEPGDTVLVQAVNIELEDVFTENVVRYVTGEHWRKLQRELAADQVMEYVAGTIAS